MGAQATACVLRVKGPFSHCHHSPQFIAGLPVCPPHRAMPRWRNARVWTDTGATLMQLKAKFTDHGELILNCLAVLALLAVGIVWGPA
jgi:hypothetical protein